MKTISYVLHVPKLKCSFFFPTKELDVARVKFRLHDTQTYLYNVNNEIIATCTLQKNLCTLGQSQY